MKNDLVEIVDEYDKDGVLVNRYVNGLCIPYPRGKDKSVQFMSIQPNWAFQKMFMTREEVKKIYGKDFAPQKTKNNYPHEQHDK